MIVVNLKRCIPLLCALLALPVLAQTPAQPGQQKQIWFDPSQPIQTRVDALVHAMTLQEKVDQMMNSAPAIPRLGVPAYNYWSEGLHGIARSGYATVFPQAIGLAATWDPTLQHEVGHTTGIEARAKYNQAMRDDLHSIFYGLTIWSPNINIVRDPRWGRGQETYGEDPFLTGRMAVAFITGLQGNDPKYFLTIATPKHFDAYSGPEPMRHKFNAQLSPRDLEATYTPAFRAAIVQGHADSLMCSYNAVDGTPSCANKMLLQQHLRDDWQFQGFVTSDCGAIDDFSRPGAHGFSPDAAHASATAVLAGTDTDCGSAYQALVQSVQQNLIPVSAIDQALERLFTARIRLGMFDPPSGVKYAQIPFSIVDSPEHRALARRVADESIVLLKNDGILPLHPDLRRVAVIGPNAASLPAIEGNYNGIPSHPSLPVDGIEAALAGRAQVLYAEGSNYVDDLPIVLPRTALHPAQGSAEDGLKGEYFANPDFSGAPALTRTDKQIEFDWDAAKPVPALPARNYSVRWTGVFTPPAPGDYRLMVRLNGCWPCGGEEAWSLWLDGKQVASSQTLPAHHRGQADSGVEFHFDSTAPHAIRVDYVYRGQLFGGGLTLQWLPPAPVLRDEAVRAAQRSDVVLAFVGLSPDLEGEEMPVHLPGFDGGDRTTIDLPQTQQDLLHALAATGKPLVVVLMSGSAVAVDWSKEHANALLEAWYPGETAGESIADVLTGRADPSGRLPLTFYAGDDQLPPFTDYSMANRTDRYFQGQPLYPFGYGLSYTTFRYSDLRLSSPSVEAGQPLAASVTVTNTGDRAGDDVAELYLIPPTGQGYPQRSLAGFARVHLDPHSSATVHFDLTPRDLSEVDASGQRAVRAGDYTLFVGGSSPGAHSSLPGVPANFTITGEKDLPQ